MNKKKNILKERNTYPSSAGRENGKIYRVRNRAKIIERNIIIVLVLFLIALIAFIVLSRTVTHSEQVQYTVHTNLAKKTDTVKSDASAEDNEEEAVDYSNSIICWGDSFSDNSANSTNSYVYYIYDLLSDTVTDIDGVYSSGIAGDGITAIAAKQGGIPMYAQPFEIPASSAQSVEIELKNSLGENVIIQDKLNSGLNPCEIAGVEGTIDYRRGKLCFTRSQDGTAKKLTDPTIVQTNAMLNIKDYTAVYFFGGDCTKYRPNEVVDMYSSMVDFVGNDKYVIVGSVTGDESTLQPYEKAMEDKFGDRFINFREYLISDAYDNYEIKLNSKDIAAIRQGSVPPSLIMNGSKLTDQGSKILADLIYHRLRQLDLI
jgi:preprotein translocase subunit SecG